MEEREVFWSMPKTKIENQKLKSRTKNQNQGPKTKIENQKPKSTNKEPKLKNQDPKSRTKNPNQQNKNQNRETKPKSRTKNQNQEPKTKIENQKLKSRINQKPKSTNYEPKYRKPKPKIENQTQNGESKTKIKNQKPKLRTKYQNQEPKASLDPAMLSYLFQSLCLALYGCTCALWKLSCDSPNCIQLPQVHLVSSFLNTYIGILVQTCKVSTNDTSSCSEIRTITCSSSSLLVLAVFRAHDSPVYTCAATAPWACYKKVHTHTNTHDDKYCADVIRPFFDAV